MPSLSPLSSLGLVYLFFSVIVLVKNSFIRQFITSIKNVGTDIRLRFRGAGGGLGVSFLPNHPPPLPPPLCSFDTHPRWRPVTHSARSRRSYGKIGDCEQSIKIQNFYILSEIICIMLEYKFVPVVGF